MWLSLSTLGWNLHLSIGRDDPIEERGQAGEPEPPRYQVFLPDGDQIAGEDEGVVYGFITHRQR